MATDKRSGQHSPRPSVERWSFLPTISPACPQHELFLSPARLVSFEWVMSLKIFILCSDCPSYTPLLIKAYPSLQVQPPSHFLPGVLLLVQSTVLSPLLRSQKTSPVALTPVLSEALLLKKWCPLGSSRLPLTF